MKTTSWPPVYGVPENPPTTSDNFEFWLLTHQFEYRLVLVLVAVVFVLAVARVLWRKKS